jgi:hypothetical protein
MLINPSGKEAIEVEFELFKNKKYESLIKWTDHKSFKLPKLIEQSYIEHKITKDEKDMYEMKLYEIIFKINTELISIYSKKRDDEVEKQRELYLRRQTYINNTIVASPVQLNPLNTSWMYDNYKKIVNYIYNFLYKFNDIFF